MNKIKSVAYVTHAGNPVVPERKAALESALGVKFNQAADISELFTQISSSGCQTDLVFVDVEKFYEVPGSSVFDLVKTLSTLANCASGVTPKLVAMLDLDTDPAQVRELLGTQALNGFYPRGSNFSIDEKSQAIREILQGSIHVPTRYRKYLSQKKRSYDISTPGYEGISLTARQNQVLSLVTRQGASNKVIARTLGISESTVKLHMTEILRKYGARNRTQLAVFASENKRSKSV